MKVIICFRLTASCACFLDRTGSLLNQKWGLLSCHCLPVNTTKSLTYDWTPLLRLSNWTQRAKQTTSSLRSPSVFRSHTWTQQHAGLFAFSQSHTALQIVSILCAEIWFALYVTAGMSSCYVSMLLLQLGAVFKLKEGNRITEVIELICLTTQVSPSLTLKNIGKSKHVGAWIHSKHEQLMNYSSDIQLTGGEFWSTLSFNMQPSYSSYCPFI